MKTFDTNFYEELFCLRCIEFDGKRLNRAPRSIGQLANDLIYERLAPGFLDELRRVNPANGKGQREHKHHQRLTTETGHPKLREHIGKVTTLMRVFDDWKAFRKGLDRTLPK